MLGLMLGCYHLEILVSEQGSPHFHFAVNPASYVASSVDWDPHSRKPSPCDETSDRRSSHDRGAGYVD